MATGKLPKNAVGKLTYGEYAEGIDLYAFLVWMKEESAPVPDNEQERNRLILDWLRYQRRAKGILDTRKYWRKATLESDSTSSTTHENPKSDKLTPCPTDLD